MARRRASSGPLFAILGLSSLCALALTGGGEPVLALLGLVSLAVAAGLRARALRRENVPLSLTVTALALPTTAAGAYLDDLAPEFHGLPRRQRSRHARNAIMNAPTMIATAWSGWTRTHLAAFAVRLFLADVSRIHATLAEIPDERTLRRLRLACRALRHATGTRQYRDLADAATTLARTCRRHLTHGDTGETLRHDLTGLLDAMHAWRPQRV